MSPKHALLDDASFRAANTIDRQVPHDYGLYAIRLREGVDLPQPFGAIVSDRGTRVLYIGEARGQRLPVRLVDNELRAKGNGTFFRSLGAVLGYVPATGSLAGRASQKNYRFTPTDQETIVRWINVNLEVSWMVLPQSAIRHEERNLIRREGPLFNLRSNPRRLPELAALREHCRIVAGLAGAETALTS